MSSETAGPPVPQAKKPRYFYGWNIVAASFMAQLSYAEHFSSMLGFYVKPLQAEFGWSRTAITAVQSIARISEAIIAPFVGPLIDRYGPRILMPIGAFIVGIAMLGITQIDALWQFYMLRGVVSAIGFTLMGALVTSVTINNWFIRKRGRALAISRIGSNLSNIIFTPVTVFVIAASGWRTMFVIFAVVTWLVALIPSMIIMRRRPEDMGLYPDGEKRSYGETLENLAAEKKIGRKDIADSREPVWSRREVLKTRAFWLLSLSFGINSLAFQGINISLAPYIQDLGYGETVLASVMTFRAVMAGTALLLVGFLAEYSHKSIIRVVPFIVQSIAVLLLFLAEEPLFLWLGVALYGLGISAVVVIQEVLWANFFGRLSLGMVRSLAFLAAFGLGAAGPIAMNAVFDLTGSYHPAFLTIIGLFSVSALVMGIARPPTARRFASAGSN